MGENSGQQCSRCGACGCQELQRKRTAEQPAAALLYNAELQPAPTSDFSRHMKQEMRAHSWSCLEESGGQGVSGWVAGGTCWEAGSDGGRRSQATGPGGNPKPASGPPRALQVLQLAAHGQLSQHQLIPRGQLRRKAALQGRRGRHKHSRP